MVKLLAIGTALPPGLLPQKEAFEHARGYSCKSEKEERVLQRLYQKTQIETRRTIFSQALNAADSDDFGSIGINNIGGKSPSLDIFYPRPRPIGDTTAICQNCDQTTLIDGQPGTAARMARYQLEIGPLAAAAARQALTKIKMPSSQVSNLVTVSCTGFFAPGLDTEIIETLALSRNVSRTHVGFMGCHGAMNGLRVGSALAGETHSISLVVAAELCSLHFQYGRKSDDLLANALFADGAAAAILSDELADDVDGEEDSGPEGSLRLLASASYLLPDSREAMTWQIGDHGFSMTLGPEVPDLIKEHLAPWLQGWLAQYGLTQASVGSWAVHPGGPRVLDAVQQALSLGPQALSQSLDIFTGLGNMSSPTILFILERLLAAHAARPIVALAFGPGLTIEAALLG